MKTFTLYLKTVALLLLLLIIYADVDAQALSSSTKTIVTKGQNHQVTYVRQSFPQKNSKENPYSNNFPFVEDWQQGNFTNNGWVFQPSQGNWIVDPASGNPAPCASFTGMPGVTNYSYSLLSPVLNAMPYTCADFWLDFDLKLIDNLSTGTEKIDVDLYYNNNWVNLIEYSNTGTTDWTHQHLAINSVKGEPFQIRFRAFGASSSGIQGWYLDNIHTYAVCRGPVDVMGFTPWNTFTTNVWWDPPICGPIYPDSQWLHWDSGENYTGIGYSGPKIFDIAARWTSDQINYLQGGTITKISFWPSSEGTATYRVRIWEGANAANLVVDQPVTTFTNDNWNWVTLDNPYMINVTGELWVGLDVNATDGYPVGCDFGPAIAGYGDMLNDGTGWAAMSQPPLNLNYNWNIQAYVEFPDPDTTGAHLIGYNIYRTPPNEPSPYSQLNSSIITARNYIDIHPYPPPYSYWHYFVTAVYEYPDSAGAELCEGLSDTILVGMTEGVPGLSNGKITVFPNPSIGIVNVSSDVSIEYISVMNCSGEHVYSETGKSGKNIVLDLSGFQDGLYFLRLTTIKGTYTTKLTVLH